MCKISVVTSVYNCEKYIAATIESVIKQTFEDWEFIIINDCSSDRSAEIIRSFSDERIVFIDNKVNRGQCESLNYGISIAKGEFIARLDHDDICKPNRLEKQYEYMKKHPEVVLVGSKCNLYIDGKEIQTGEPIVSSAQEMRFALNFDNQIPHSSFFIRKSTMIEAGIRYGEYQYAEDYALLFDLIKVGEIALLNEPLVLYRIFDEQFTATCSHDLITEEVLQIRNKFVDLLPIEYREIYKTSNECNLLSKQDYSLFVKGYKYAASEMGLSMNDKQNRRCVKELFKNILLRQPATITRLFAYTLSGLTDWNWLFSKDGIYFSTKAIWINWK